MTLLFLIAFVYLLFAYQNYLNNQEKNNQTNNEDLNFDSETGVAPSVKKSSPISSQAIAQETQVKEESKMSLDQISINSNDNVEALESEPISKEKAEDSSFKNMIDSNQSSERAIDNINTEDSRKYDEGDALNDDDITSKEPGLILSEDSDETFLQDEPKQNSNEAN